MPKNGINTVCEKFFFYNTDEFLCDGKLILHCTTKFQQLTKHFYLFAHSLNLILTKHYKFLNFPSGSSKTNFREPHSYLRFPKLSNHLFPERSGNLAMTVKEDSKFKVEPGATTNTGKRAKRLSCQTFFPTFVQLSVGVFF